MVKVREGFERQNLFSFICVGTREAGTLVRGQEQGVDCVDNRLLQEKELHVNKTWSQNYSFACCFERKNRPSVALAFLPQIIHFGDAVSTLICVEMTGKKKVKYGP